MLDQSVRESWEALSEQLGAFIGRRLPAQDAEDVLQDVLLRIHRNIHGLSDHARFGPWVYSIARNAIVDRQRQRSMLALDSGDVPEPEAASEEVDESVLASCVAPFVARLPSPYREAITLVELKGLRQQDAAEIAGVSLSGMKSRVQRGRRLLREMFEDCCKLTIDGRGRVIDAMRHAPGDRRC